MKINSGLDLFDTTEDNQVHKEILNLLKVPHDNHTGIKICSVLENKNFDKKITILKICICMCLVIECVGLCVYLFV